MINSIDDNKKAIYGIIKNEAEKKLLEYLRAIPYGQVTIFMQDSIPVRIERIKESIML